MWLGNQKQGRFVVLGCPSKTHRLDKLHYVGVSADEGVIVDSARSTMLRLDYAGVLGVLPCGVDKIYQICEISDK